MPGKYQNYFEKKNRNFHLYFSELLPIFSNSSYSYTTKEGSDWTLRIKN
jgi:hypothetical protein